MEDEMVTTAIEAVQADRAALLEICAGLSDAEWSALSGCAGWSVQDLIAHLGALFWLMVDPSALPDAAGVPTERAQDRYVEGRRSWTSAAVLADYESVSAKGLDQLASLAGQDFEMLLGDLGTYPASVLPSAYAFDHYTHIREDLHSPRGPLTRQPPPADELRLSPAVDWAQAALPQQNSAAIAGLTGAVDISLTGPGGRSIRLGAGAPASHLNSDTASFVRWITQRSTWEAEGVDASGGDRDLALLRTLKVF
jgi:uncharacterized protein (TIGR03083 family)